MSKAIKVIVYIVIILVLLAGVGLIVKFTNGFTDDFKTFFVTVDGTDVLDSKDGFVFQYDEPLKVDVKYVFSTNKEETKDFTVKVIPNKIEGKDFDFTVDGEAYSFQEETDLTKGFEIVKDDSSFTIKPKGDLSEILKACYPDKTIEIGEGSTYEDMYTLVVTSYNEKATVKLHFMLFDGVYKITLDKENITF